MTKNVSNMNYGEHTPIEDIETLRKLAQIIRSAKLDVPEIKNLIKTENGDENISN